MNKLKRYSVDVLGRIWQSGELCCYTYNLGLSDHEPTLQEIKRAAGDFSTVTDYRLSCLDRCPHCGGVQRTVLRDWEEPDSAEQWCKIAWSKE